MKRFKENRVIDADGDVFSAGLSPDENGRWVLYEEAMAEIEDLKTEIKRRKDKASFDNAWDGY